MRPRWIVPLTALLVLALAGCGSGGGGSGVATVNGGSAATTSGASDSSEDQGIQLARCLREHGIDAKDPDPSTGLRSMLEGVQVDQGKLRTAMQSCQRFLSGAAGQNAGRISEADKQKMLDYTRCLRQQGIDIGDPDPQTGVPSDVRKLLNPNDPKLRAAETACQRYAPKALQGGGGSR
jgi:hypothetical protein